jgi:hypothetical protein
MVEGLVRAGGGGEALDDASRRVLEFRGSG